MSLGTRQYIINYNTCILDSLTHAHIQRTFIHTHTYIYKKIVLRVDRTGFTRNLGKHDTHTHLYILYYYNGYMLVTVYIYTHTNHMGKYI